MSAPALGVHKGERGDGCEDERDDDARRPEPRGAGFDGAVRQRAHRRHRGRLPHPIEPGRSPWRRSDAAHEEQRDRADGDVDDEDQPPADGREHTAEDGTG